jgi:hypothetical protein
MSAEILELIVRDGHSPTERKPQDHEAVVKLKVEDLRNLGLWVGHDPIADVNPYHASVWGITRALQKRLLQLCEWIEKPLDVH